MTLKINGETQTFPESALKLDQLLSLIKVESPDVVTVQLNGNFVDRKLFGTTQLQENDEVEFLYFLGGGQS